MTSVDDPDSVVMCVAKAFRGESSSSVWKFFNPPRNCNMRRPSTWGGESHSEQWSNARDSKEGKIVARVAMSRALTDTLRISHLFTHLDISVAARLIELMSELKPQKINL